MDSSYEPYSNPYYRKDLMPITTEPYVINRTLPSPPNVKIPTPLPAFDMDFELTGNATKYFRLVPSGYVGDKDYDRMYYVRVDPLEPYGKHEEIRQLPSGVVRGTVIGYEKATKRELFRVDVVV